MTAKNEMLLRRWLEEVWNKGREDVVEEMFDENAVAVYTCVPMENPVRGIREFKAFLRLVRRSFLDLNVTIEDIISEGEKVTAMCRFFGKKPDAAGGDAHTETEVFGLCVVKIRNGKIIEAWNNLDPLNSGRQFDDLLLRPV